ncbi:MAG: class II fructose-bisphosphate aldolase, partial [Bacteroidota bacterium]
MSKQSFRSGVLFGDEVTKLFRYANENKFAIPAVNVTSSSTVNAVLETAKALNSPVIIQFSNGGAQFFAGKGMGNDNQKGAIQGGLSG